MKQSKRFQLNELDYKKIATNALLFIAPDLITFLGALQLKFSAEGAFVAVLALNLIIDLLKKFINGK